MTNNNNRGIIHPPEHKKLSPTTHLYRNTRTSPSTPTFRPLQCYHCRALLLSPVTLPCGISLCHHCIPKPETIDFQSQFRCPLPSCARSGIHPVEELAVDVTLQSITSSLRTAASLSPTLANILSEDQENARDHDQPETLYYGSLTDQDPTWDATLEGLFDPYAIPQSAKAASPSNLSGPSPTVFYHNILQIIDTIRPKIQQEIECQVCFMIFDRPLTTVCGHTFCHSCLITSLDHNPTCPLCRHKLPLYMYFHNQPPNKALVRFIRYLLEHPQKPDASGETGNNNHNSNNNNSGSTTSTNNTTFSSSSLLTASIHAQPPALVVEQHDLEKTLAMTPLFINSLIFPRMPCYLLVFEPRYRKLLRNVLKTESKLFGMVLPPRIRKQHQYREPSSIDSWEPSSDTGTLLKVISCELLPDGRALVETVGLSRFQILTYSMMEGYYTATAIELIHDIPEVQELGLEKAALLEKAMVLYRAAKKRKASKVDKGPDREPDRQELDLLVSRRSSASSSLSLLEEALSTVVIESSLIENELETPDNNDSDSRSSSSHQKNEQDQDDDDATDSLDLRNLHELDLEALTREQMMKLLLDFVSHMQTRLGPLATQRLEREFGEMVEDQGQVFSFWIGSILPVRNDQKYDLLKERSVRRRLLMVLEWIKEIEARRSMTVCTIS
ncbi:hypothetical protein BGZ83_008653 [Gryganskiella cystojenkinii]|nr:hypothetical protein BGZ83_008653 [Gryganskiella cystojenkinii]